MWNYFPPFPYFLYSFILWSSSNRISFLFRSRLYSEDFFLIFRLSSALSDIIPHNRGTFCSRTLCFVLFFFLLIISKDSVYQKKEWRIFSSSVFTCMVVLFQRYSWTTQWSIPPLSNHWFKTRSFSGFGFVIFVF